MALEDKEIMVDTAELEPLTESEKEEEPEVEAEVDPDPAQDPEVDPMKELELEADGKDQEEAEKEDQEAGSKAQLSREGSLSLKSPSAEEERSATRTLIRQPSPVVETSDGEEHDQVYSHGQKLSYGFISDITFLLIQRYDNI